MIRELMVDHHHLRSLRPSLRLHQLHRWMQHLKMLQGWNELLCHLHYCRFYFVSCWISMVMISPCLEQDRYLSPSSVSCLMIDSYFLLLLDYLHELLLLLLLF